VKLARFQTTPESQQALDNLALAARVKGRIIEEYPTASVTAHGGMVMVHIKAAGVLEPTIEAKIKALAGQIPGVQEMKVHVIPLSI
jgi:hypothetical protein